MMTDPTRLLDDPSIAASLRADLAQAEAAGLVGFDPGAGAASLQAAIAAEATTATTATATIAGAGKALVLGLVGVVSAGAIALVSMRSPEPRTVSAIAPSVVAVEPPSLHEPAPEVVPELPEPEVELSEPEVEPPEMLAEPEPEADMDEPEAKLGRPTPRAERATDDYLREAKLIADARRAMKRDPARALEILADAERAFPRGILGEEREALTILSLDGLGRTTEARSRGRKFLEAHDKSPYADAVRQVLH